MPCLSLAAYVKSKTNMSDRKDKDLKKSYQKYLQSNFNDEDLEVDYDNSIFEIRFIEKAETKKRRETEQIHKRRKEALKYD
jgi:hypothetical protein